MKSIIRVAILASAALFIGGCAMNKDVNSNPNTNAANTNSNTTGNSSKPVAAAPTVDALFALDKQANEAWIKNDATFFQGFLSDKFVQYDGGKRTDKAGMLKMLASFKCDMKTWSLEDPQMAMIDADTAVVSYKANFDGTCADPDGKSMKIPSPVRAASVYVREGDTWKGVFHGENPIIDPKAPPPPPTKPAPKKEPKTDAKAANSNSANSNSEANAAAGAATPTAPDALTDALVKVQTEGWEAFKAKDAKKLEQLTATNLSTVDPAGMWFGNKADVIKHWTVDVKCEGMNNVKVTDGIGTALSPSVEILTTKGTADGTCDGQKNGTLYQTSFYVKENDQWKLAFMFEAM